MRKLKILLLIVIISAFTFTGCGNSNKKQDNAWYMQGHEWGESKNKCGSIGAASQFLGFDLEDSYSGNNVNNVRYEFENSKLEYIIYQIYYKDSNQIEPLIEEKIGKPKNSYEQSNGCYTYEWYVEDGDTRIVLYDTHEEKTVGTDVMYAATYSLSKIEISRK